MHSKVRKNNGIAKEKARHFLKNFILYVIEHIFCSFFSFMWFFLCTFADSFKQIKAKRTSRIMAKHKIWNTDSAAKEVANLWGGIEGEQLAMMKTHIQVTKYKKGEIIYENGTIPKEAMCLLAGKVKIYKDGINGKSQIIRVIKPSEFLGFRAFFANEAYRTAAMALDNCVVAHFPMTVLMKMLQSSYNIGFYFIKYLSVEIGKSDDRTVNLTQKHIRARLAEALLFLLDSYGLAKDGCTLDCSLSREDLANIANMTTSNCIRTLSSFVTEGLISTNVRKIKILNEEELKNIAERG